MEHHHDHDHHRHSYNPAAGNRFLWTIGINLLYVAAEFYLGFRCDSADFRLLHHEKNRQISDFLLFIK